MSLCLRLRRLTARPAVPPASMRIQPDCKEGRDDTTGADRLRDLRPDYARMVLYEIVKELWKLAPKKRASGVACCLFGASGLRFRCDGLGRFAIPRIRLFPLGLPADAEA